LRALAVAAACAFVVSCGHPARQSGRSSLAPAPLPTFAPTPVPSPAPRWSAQELHDLQQTLASIFDSDVTRTATGLVVVAGDGTTLFSRRGAIPVAPASTLKLVVAAGALDTLGPAHRFETRFVASAQPDASGDLRGNLWLVGGGDPTLTSQDLENGVGVLSRSGIQRIDGTLEIDNSAFSGPEQNPQWEPDDLSYDYAAGTSAISLDQNVVEFDVTPDPGGGAASVRPVPPNASISFTGRIATVPSGYNSFVTIDRKLELPPLAKDPAKLPSPRNVYAVDGQIAQNGMQVFYKPVLGMPGYIGGAVASMLAQRRIGLSGGYGSGTAPALATTLWAHRSAPLSDIVREMLVNSNNHTAETLLRILGEQSGRPGTDAAGVGFEKRVMDHLGVPHDKMRVFDGSGLAPSDRIEPQTLAKLLALEARGPAGDVYVRSLPRVGLEGTVKHHDLHAALGRARAKSGHIENVNGLAGVLQTLHHGRIAFAFIVNDTRANADVVYDEEDRALDALTAF
jgi:D-alanyl-D-alanine carboxypeptidase/D-alanyl-D-alanine-endopeptidase (penicillin-binding protein 4)